MPELNSADSPPTPLIDIVDKTVPWAELGGMQRVVIARSSSSELVLPGGVQMSPKKLVGGPTTIRGERAYGNASMATARWAQDDQETMRVCSLVCVVSGHADFQLGDYVLHCPEGTFIFVPPGTPNPKGSRSHLEGANRADGSCDLLWFSPRGRRVQAWMCFSRATKHVISMGNDNIFLLNDRIIQYIESMEDEAATRQPGYEKMFQSALLMFLVAAQRELHAGHFLQLNKAGPEVNAGASRKKDYDPIVRAQEFIRANLAGSLSVAKVSGAVHMSRAQFTRRFLAQTGCTFTEFTNQCRLEQAKIFLRDTDWSVAQIGGFVGFRSTAYFHTLFRRYFEISPMAYRIEKARQREQCSR